MTHTCRPSSDPRRKGRCACGKSITVTYGMRDRDIELERYLASIAAQAVGYIQINPDGTVTGDDGGLNALADSRALPGGVRADMDYDREGSEELADFANYMKWGIEPIYADVRAGSSQHTADYGRRMGALSLVVAAWRTLHYTGP